MTTTPDIAPADGEKGTVIQGPIPCPEHRKVKQFEFYIDPDDGMGWTPNACARCEKWFPPYGSGVPADEADDYCWGHEIEDAIQAVVATYRDIVERNASQMERECKHPPCEHAAGMRLALSYLDDAVVLSGKGASE